MHHSASGPFAAQHAQTSSMSWENSSFAFGAAAEDVDHEGSDSRSAAGSVRGFSTHHSSGAHLYDQFDNEGKLSTCVKEAQTLSRKVVGGSAFGRRDSINSMSTARRSVKMKLTMLTTEEVIRARTVYDNAPHVPLYSTFHVTSLLMALGVGNLPSTRDIEKILLKTSYSPPVNTVSMPQSPKKGGDAAKAPQGAYIPLEASNDLKVAPPLPFETFLEVIELLKRSHRRQLNKEDECFEAFESLNYRYRTSTSSLQRRESKVSLGSDGESMTGRGGKKAIPLQHLEDVVRSTGVEYDFRSLLSAVDAEFNGNVTPTQFRWCAGTEDPTIVKAFVTLGGEESLSGTIPVEVLISRCSAMGMTPQYIANFVNEIDVNNDGVVDYSEFLAMIIRNKESKELKRAWSAGPKNIRRSSSDRVSPTDGGGEGFHPFPRRSPFRRPSVQPGNRPSFQATPPGTPSLAPMSKTEMLERDIHLDEETNRTESSSSEEDEESSDGGSDTSVSAYDDVDAVLAPASPTHPHPGRARRRTAFGLDLQGLFTKKDSTAETALSKVEKIANVTAKGKAAVQVHRQRTAKYLATEATVPVKKIVTEKDGLVDVSTEKGRNQIKYYFGLKKRLPPKFAKVSARLVAQPKHVAERLRREAELASAPPEKPAPPRLSRTQVVAPIMVAVTAALAYLSHVTYDAPPTDPSAMFQWGHRPPPKSPRRPSTAKSRDASSTPRDVRTRLSGRRPATRPSAATPQRGVVEQLDLDRVVMESLNLTPRPPSANPSIRHGTASSLSLADSTASGSAGRTSPLSIDMSL